MSAIAPERSPVLWIIMFAVLVMVPLTPSAVAGEGQIILLRDVPSRPATRSAPPGRALTVRTSPAPEVRGALGTTFSIGTTLTDGEAALVSASGFSRSVLGSLGQGGFLAAPTATRFRASAGFGASTRGIGQGIAGHVGGATRPVGAAVGRALTPLTRP